MIGSEKRFEKASDALLSMQTEIASAMERPSETPYAVASTQTYDMVTGDSSVRCARTPMTDSAGLRKTFTTSNITGWLITAVNTRKSRSSIFLS